METLALNWLYRATIAVATLTLLAVTTVATVATTDVVLATAGIVVGFASGHSSKR